MAKKVQVRTKTVTRTVESPPPPVANPEVIKNGKKLQEDVDKLIDEIDDVLQTNREELLHFVQKGGE